MFYYCLNEFIYLLANEIKLDENGSLLFVARYILFIRIIEFILQ